MSRVMSCTASYKESTYLLICCPQETRTAEGKVLEMFTVRGMRLSFCSISLSSLMKCGDSSQGGNFLQSIDGRELRRGQVTAFPQPPQSWSESPVAFF